MARNPGGMGSPSRPPRQGQRRSARIALRQPFTTTQGSPSNRQSNSSRSSGKRPHLDLESSIIESESTSVWRHPNTRFSAGTKGAINADGYDCWHCGSIDALQHIHVIGRTRDDVGRYPISQSIANTVQVLKRLRDLGMANVEAVNQRGNGMVLCIWCHGGFDDPIDPAWVFVPTDPKFFIDNERADYKHRIDIFKETREFPKRTPPTAAQYGETGGLYDAYMLRHYGPDNNGWQRGRSTLLPQSKQWSGDPMLALHKGFKALPGNWDILPPELEQLSKLYVYNNAPPSPNVTSPSDGDHDGDDDSIGGQGGRKGPTKPPTPQRGTKGKGQGNAAAIRGARSRGQVHDSPGTKHRLPRISNKTTKRIKVQVSPWRWGPQVSSDYKVRLLHDYREYMGARGYHMGYDSLPEERNDPATAKSHSGVTGQDEAAGYPMTEHHDAADDRQLGGVGCEGVREWLSRMPSPRKAAGIFPSR